MIVARTRNVPASVLDRLLRRSRETGEDYQTLLTTFICERFLYRLSVSPVAERYVLEGALLLRVWSEQPYRATRDLDLLRQGDVGTTLHDDIVTVCATIVEDDGVTFDGASIRLEPIREADEYAGIRVTLQARCGTARIALQVDVGTADVVWPSPTRIDYPSLLGFARPRVRAYAPETVVAEKLEAMVVLGDRNSRIKDSFDLRYLAGHFEFDRRTLAEAIRRTFERRRTPVPAGPPAGLTNAYWENPARAAQVTAFARRAGLDVGGSDGRDIAAVLNGFLGPLLDDVRNGAVTDGTWAPGGPWR
jgi:nucleotidyltransferase AbiEii toxin of type IV toxin-antitoxin system